MGPSRSSGIEIARAFVGYFLSFSVQQLVCVSMPKEEITEAKTINKK